MKHEGKGSDMSENGYEYPFWLVWRDGTVPIVKHPNEQGAKDEAERLAKQNPDNDFYVLKAEYRLKAIKPVECVKMEIPF